MGMSASVRDGTAGVVARQRARLALVLAGGGLLAASAAIHLDLYLTGYRTIPTIGWLFLLQVIAGFGLAAAVLATGSRLAAAAGAVFALSTLGGYLLSIWVGLFGFREVRTTAGIAAGVIEIAAFAALAFIALVPAIRRSSAGPAAGSPAERLLGMLRTGVPGAVPLLGAVSVVALALLGVAVAQAGTAPPPSAAATATTLRTIRIGSVTVLTNAKGLTLYWFAPDSATRSRCTGSCAAYWPPVTGKPRAGPGVTGTLGTVRRPDGSVQATFDGHPLYTYIGDSAPGQAHGNNLNLNGGLWHEVIVRG
jgi:predicted lipoprotein with Yx(FWY)xxD motif